MKHKDSLVSLYAETFASTSTFFYERIEEYATKNGRLFVMEEMRKAKALSKLLGWENASFALFEAILYGDLQTKVDEEGEANAEPTD